MSKFSYIEHLNIPTKYKGSILHSYEYNATVNKINEIVDSLHISYEYHQSVPDFTVTDNPLTSTSPGTGVTINNSADGKLYPITSSSYVITDTNKTLKDTIDDITNSFIDVRNRIVETKNSIDTLSDDVNTQMTNLYNRINTEVLDTIISYRDTINSDVEALRSYTYTKIPELYQLIDNIDVELIEGDGISINDRTISANVDNDTIFVNSYGQLVVNKEVVLYDAANTIQFINEQGEWVGNTSKIKDYIDDSVNTTYTTLKQDITDIYAYVNKYTEYEEFGKSYELSIDFINSQK